MFYDTPGRPRERWHVTDYPVRFDANAIRRQVLAAGQDPGRIDAILVHDDDKPEASAERIGVVVAPDSRYGWRLWFLCPDCGRPCLHLYPQKRRTTCRRCGGIGYADGRSGGHRV